MTTGSRSRARGKLTVILGRNRRHLGLASIQNTGIDILWVLP